MSDIRAGDVVVRVHVGQSLCVRRNQHIRLERERGRSTEPGRAYTVEAVIPGAVDNCPSGLVLAGVASRRGLGGAFCSGIFRKIDRASDEFTRQVRACRPVERAPLREAAALARKDPPHV